MGKVQKNEFFISGRVVFVGNKKEFSPTFSKREIVIKAKVGKYETPVPLDYINDNMDLLDNIRKGDWVNIDFRIRGYRHENENGTVKYVSVIEGLTCIKED